MKDFLKLFFVFFALVVIVVIVVLYAQSPKQPGISELSALAQAQSTPTLAYPTETPVPATAESSGALRAAELRLEAAKIERDTSERNLRDSEIQSANIESAKTLTVLQAAQEREKNNGLVLGLTATAYVPTAVVDMERTTWTTRTEGPRQVITLILFFGLAMFLASPVILALKLGRKSENATQNAAQPHRTAQEAISADIRESCPLNEAQLHAWVSEYATIKSLLSAPWDDSRFRMRYGQVRTRSFLNWLDKIEYSYVHPSQTVGRQWTPTGQDWIDGALKSIQSDDDSGAE